MRPDRRWRAFDGAVLVGAVAALGFFLWVGFLAATDRTIPYWAWAILGSVCVIGTALVALQDERHGADVGHFRHSSGELVIVHGYRERRRRRTRLALDWKYRFRGYLIVPTALFGALMGGFDLLAKHVWWQQAGGALLVVGALAATAALVRWLLLPVDPDSKERLDAYYEEMRFDWGALGRRVDSWRSRRRNL